MAEVARKYLREGAAVTTIRKSLSTILEASELLDLDAELALTAARATIRLERRAEASGLRRPNLFDGIVMASARLNGAKVLTGDER